MKGISYRLYQIQQLTRINRIKMHDRRKISALSMSERTSMEGVNMLFLQTKQ